MWAIATGLLLTAYVATWYAALARAQAVDVTAVLVFGAVVTAVIARVADGAVVDPVGTALITAGAVLVASSRVRPPERPGRDHMTAGPLLFARYAYPPNSLGYCGADETRTLLEYGDAGTSDGGLAELARTFEGAWPYLTLIADANRIADPLDPRVVQAYWVGNELLDHVAAERRLHATSTSASADASAARRSISSTPSRPAPSRTIRSTSSPSTRGSVSSEPGSSRSRCMCSTMSHHPGTRVSPSRATRPSTRLRPLCWNGTTLELGSWTSRTVSLARRWAVARRPATRATGCLFTGTSRATA